MLTGHGRDLLEVYLRRDGTNLNSIAERSMQICAISCATLEIHTKRRDGTSGVHSPSAPPETLGRAEGTR